MTSFALIYPLNQTVSGSAAVRQRGTAAKMESPAEAGLGCDRLPGAAPPERRPWVNGITPFWNRACCSLHLQRHRRYPDDRPEFRTLENWYQLPSAAQLCKHFYAGQCAFANTILQTRGMLYAIGQKQALNAKCCETAQAAAAAACSLSKVITPFLASTRMTSFGPNRPSNICFASGFSSCD